MTYEREPGLGKLEEGAGAALIKLLVERYGQPTTVRFADGTEFTISDGTGWGRDYGDLWEHVIATTDDGRVEFFYLSKVEALIEPTSGAVLASQQSKPGET